LTLHTDRGQGLNHAITDATKLLNAIIAVEDKSQVFKAVTEYEQEMIPRTKAETELSVENTFMVHDWARVQESPMVKVGIVKTS
jgi:2-polyprenyl-6-methoxyphenol hydroxylase-like FAD-dependent oxidoreductase